jgi:hypothetical protein
VGAEKDRSCLSRENIKYNKSGTEIASSKQDYAFLVEGMPLRSENLKGGRLRIGASGTLGGGSVGGVENAADFSGGQ